MARKKNPEAEEGSDYDDFDYGEEPDFSDPEGFVDDISDEELMPEIMRMRPKETDGVESVIVVLLVDKGFTARSIELNAAFVARGYATFTGRLFSRHWSGSLHQLRTLPHTS